MMMRHERIDIWPYRTDVKYSLFYQHPPKYNEDTDEEYYPHPHEDDEDEYQYESRVADDDENLNIPYHGHGNPPYQQLATFSPMVPTVEDTALELDTAVLEKIFIGV